jgi:signal transduction histidine kinase
MKILTKPSKLSQFTTRYLAALQMHWEKGPQLGLAAAQELGETAVALHLATLRVAVIHEQALKKLIPATWKPAKVGVMTNRATLFFNKVIEAIEMAHPASLKSAAGLKKASSSLQQRTRQLAASHSALKEGIASRKTANRRLKVSQQRSDRLIKESSELERQLHEVAQRIIESTEAQRKKISLTLHEEIAQTLLGIHVRLLTLKKEVRKSKTGFSKEIASTQRLVTLSVDTIKRFAVEFGRADET